MNKIKKILFVFIFTIIFTSTVFADEVIIPDSSEILRALPCDECGSAMVQSSKTVSILNKQNLIVCGSVYGTPGWGDDWKLTYDVYNSYVCSACGYTLPRSYIGQQVKYYCIEGGVYYNPVTGQNIRDDYYVENHDEGSTDEYEYNLSYDNISNTGEVIQNEVVIDGVLGEVCSECNTGSLLASNILILSDSYTVQSRTVSCIETPEILTRKDQVWRYYFYNTYKCNYCGTLYEREKTQYYEEWGFCSHGGGKYPLNVYNRGLILTEN